jgi:hypothetical protein
MVAGESVWRREGWLGIFVRVRGIGVRVLERRMLLLLFFLIFFLLTESTGFFRKVGLVLDEKLARWGL